MKKCPSCSRTYTDESLSFCLDDGSPLLSVGGSSPSYDPSATLQYTPARETKPPPTQVYGPGQAPPGAQPFTPTPSWTPMPGQAQPKKSKAIYWILGGVAALVVVGIGAVVLIVALASMDDSNANNSNTSNVGNNRNGNANNANASSTNQNSGSSRKDYQLKDDFSAAKWWIGANTFGQAEYVNGEYRLAGTVFEGYVVVYGPKKDDYMIENVTARVTTRSVTGTSPTMGYGLAVYGELKGSNLEDYSFLIRTDESPAFRVALHQNGKETTLITWTLSSLIRTGSTPNQLEVRANDDQLSFYINGQYATSVSDTAGYKRGYVGFYTSDTAQVAFDDLEIYK